MKSGIILAVLFEATLFVLALLTYDYLRADGMPKDSAEVMGALVIIAPTLFIYWALGVRSNKV